jgi:predicted enzyme related to lactoylglutathione lyase
MLLYVLVDSIDETAGRVVELGGALQHDKTAIPGFGWVATVSDPHGNRIGLFQEDGEAA